MRSGSRSAESLLTACAACAIALAAYAMTAAAGQAPPAVGVQSLQALDAREVARGRQAYLRHCAACHGPQVEGAPRWEKPDARGNLPPPPHDDSGHTWRHPDAQLADIIRHGFRDPFNQTPELTMPPFNGVLTDEEVAAVIAYFKSLWSPEHRRYQEQQNRRPAMPMQRSDR